MPEETGNGFYGYFLHYFPHLFPGTLSCMLPATYVFPSYPGFVYTGIAEVPIYDSDMYTIGFGMSGSNYYNPIGTSESQYYIYYYKDSVPCGSFVGINPNTTAIASVTSSIDVQISPNPANDFIHITTNKQFDNNTLISVFDVTGRLIDNSKADNQNAVTINTSAWNAGLYMVVIQNSSGVIRREKVAVLK
jgi:hypothetical protein